MTEDLLGERCWVGLDDWAEKNPSLSVVESVLGYYTYSTSL
jgi:hypothetical protein